MRPPCQTRSEDQRNGAACAGGGTHDPASSPDYFLARNAQLMFPAWSQCGTCSAAFTAKLHAVEQDILDKISQPAPPPAAARKPVPPPAQAAPLR